jgi:hypothetical protein
MSPNILPVSEVEPTIGIVFYYQDFMILFPFSRRRLRQRYRVLWNAREGNLCRLENEKHMGNEE